MRTPHSSANIVKAYIGMALSTIIIGLSFVFVKISLSFASPLDVLAHRFNAAALLLLFLMAIGTIKAPKLNRKQLLQLLSISVFYPLLFFSLQVIGLQYTSASVAGILSAITPVLTLILASLFLKEKSTIGQIVGVLVSIVGTCYIFYKSGVSLENNSMKGNLIIILSVVSIVCYYIFGRKLNHQFRTIDITIVMIFLAAILFNVSAFVPRMLNGNTGNYFEPLSHFSFIFSILYLGILSTVVTSIFNNYALANISASQVAVINNLTPVVSVIGGVVILHEQLQLYHVIGAALVIIGVAATTLFRKNTANKS